MSLLGDIWDITPTGMVINYITKETYGPALLSISNQGANLDAIDDFFARAEILTSRAQKVRDEWNTWFPGLSWYQKNVDENIAAQAFNRRNDFMRANVMNDDELANVNVFLSKVPPVDPVTGKVNRVTATGDRILTPEPIIPTSYKVVAAATGAGVAVLVLLKKLHIL